MPPTCLSAKALAKTERSLGMAGKPLERTTFANLISDGALEIGDGYRAKNKELGGDGLVFLRAGHVTDTHIDFDGVERFHTELEPRVRSKLAKPGDAVITTKGNSTGRTTFVSPSMPPFVYSPHLSYWRSLDPNRIEGGFLRYWCKGSEFTRQLAGMKASTDMAPYLSLVDQKRLEITLPPVAEQRTIAHILGTLDDKIELNRRMNETLEAIARALFKSWFVDFDPVRRKMARKGRGQPSPNPLPKGEDPSPAASHHPLPLGEGWGEGVVAGEAYDHLFPDSFERSELGEIPKGWKPAPLPNAIDVNPTRALRKGVEAPYLDMANMPTQGHSPDEVVDRAFGSGMRFANGDTLVARITPCLENGKTAFVDFLETGEVGWGSTEYIVLRPKPPLPDEFAYCLARSNEFRDFAIQRMTGSSGRQRVPAESLSHFRVVVAPKPVAEFFGQLIKPLFARSSAANKEARTLDALRDTLLPKLISGELRVKDAERFANTDYHLAHLRIRTD
jgi:type I restriction enzyme S subunit